MMRSQRRASWTLQSDGGRRSRKPAGRRRTSADAGADTTQRVRAATRNARRAGHEPPTSRPGRNRNEPDTRVFRCIGPTVNQRL